MKAKCGAALRLYSSAEICPALIWNDNRYICNLMTLPGKIGEGYREELYAGEGCCSGLNSWRFDVKKRETQKEETLKNLDPMFQMFLRALGSEMISGDTLFFIVTNFEDQLKLKGISDKEIFDIKKLVIHHIKNNRNKMFDSFIGEFNQFD